MRSLDDAVRDIRREENDVSKRLSRSSERVAKIRESEAELFRKLAALRLDSDMQKQIEGQLSRAEREARNVLKSHAASFASSEQQIELLDEKIAALAEDRRKALTNIDVHQEKLKALAKQISTIIANDPEFEKKRAVANQLQAIANESLKKTTQAEADQEQKGRPYRQDPLFSYLWEKGYGTTNYKANNLVRLLDAKVARFIGYQDARTNFSMLNEIPLRLREHAERQMEAAEKAEEALDEIEARAVTKAGGDPIKKALAETQNRIEAIDREMVKAEDERDELVKKLRQLAEGREPAFAKAVKNLAKAMQGREIIDLMAQARQTRTVDDDIIISKIDDARVRLIDEENETGELRERLKVLARRRRELEDIAWEFKKSQFDDPRSVFRRDELVGDLLNEFLHGAITAASYWGQWQRSQNWRAGTTDWGGGVGLPNKGRRSNWPQRGPWSAGGSSRNGAPGSRPSRSKSGKFNRPRSSSRSGSRGSRKSGGFKTGGGF
ncbi:hypothetical protein MNBD_ALPHA12-1904 [hydrothermal vent metagenome]|uniref:Uncharacterized protein n=1 Tax=hydrothermal vent metagenome TaxID=652676 RepID=A0A3B0U2E7_9ZZZZ